MQHFISIEEHDGEALAHVLAVARRLRDERDAGEPNEPMLTGRTLAMFFEKPSLRTRVSFQQAVTELGGNSIVLSQAEVGLGRRESVGDFTRVMAGMVHGIAARVFRHDHLLEMAKHSGGVPIINMLSDHCHPCQAMADIMTMQDEFGMELAGRTLTFVGDGNNVARSLAWLCAKFGMRFILAAPDGYKLEESLFAEIEKACPGCSVSQTTDPAEAVKQADAIYADTFVSMGQETERQKRLDDLAAYQINAKLLAGAPDDAIVLHCLPAYRGVEITDEAMDGPQSRVFQQAHNRLHAQKGLLAVLMGGM